MTVFTGNYMGSKCNMTYCLQLIILYLKAGGNTVAKNQKSDTTTILGAFRLYEMFPGLKSPQQQIDGILPNNPKKDAIFVKLPNLSKTSARTAKNHFSIVLIYGRLA